MFPLIITGKKMAKYQVEVQIRVPASRNPSSGAVKFKPESNSWSNKKVTVEASSAEEARKKVAKDSSVVKAKERAAARLDSDMPRPRHKVISVTRGGGAVGGGTLKTPDEYGGLKKGVGGTRRKMNKGGLLKRKKK